MKTIAFFCFSRAARLVAGSLVLAATAGSLQACTDDDTKADVCRPASAGPTIVASDCNATTNAEAIDPQSALPAEAFRAHAVGASSAAGLVGRLSNGVATWFATCLASAIGATLVEAFGATPGEIACGQYEGSASYAFAKGDYAFDLHQSVSVLGSELVGTDSHASARFTFTKPLAGFREGEVVPFDLGRSDSFLVGARPVATSTGAAALAYDRPGPLVELLGLGASPANPIVLSVDTSQRMRDTMQASLAVEGATRMTLADCSHRTHIELAFDRTPAGTDLRTRLVSAETSAVGSSEPRVVAQKWDVVYAMGLPNAPTGTIEAELRGDRRLTRSNVVLGRGDATSADLALSCAKP